jgi:DNA invertase Pin-like site-specific DNA recombinase
MIREWCDLGRVRAKLRGVKFGRKGNYNEGVAVAVRLMWEKGVAIKVIAREPQIGVGSVYTGLKAA